MREPVDHDVAAEAVPEGPAHAAWSALSNQRDASSMAYPPIEVPARAGRSVPVALLPTPLAHRDRTPAVHRRRWRPVGSNDLRQFQRRLEACLRAWLRAWLPQPGLVRSHVRERSNAMPGTTRRLLGSPNLTITARNSALTSIAWRALDMARLEHEPADDATRAIVAAMTEHVGADLEHRLRALQTTYAQAGKSHHAAWEEGRVHRIDIDADQFTSMVEVHVAEDYFRTMLPLPERAGAGDVSDRGRMTAALYASALDLRCVLGTCALRVERLLQLQPGDLLVLNRSVHEPVCLSLQGQTHGPIASGTVGQVGGRLALKLNYVEQSRDE